MKNKIRTNESFAIANGKPGDSFITRKEDRIVTANASFHGKKITTERCLLVRHNANPMTTEEVVLVTIV